ncbi:hypothetical protein VRU48_02345 [Pedobacter sp. KR3-3]|uniref:DUF922 domain-containing protein n=1 Tax=Pedobacter albus TaxID=3113905 RepID=A0ABU7I396_9SPHI|nr:hypothetical protein [Pedobacter sp. KR3-3]MEE1943930.1 hypothetical protein [Pedobacter sp. KR3-3]
MKTVLNFTIVILIVCLSSFKAGREVYPEQLDWDTHFRGEPDSHSAYAALTVTTWHYSYTSKIRDGHLSIDFKFAAGVDPTRSWVKRDRISNRKTSRQLLNHEQGHVYINFLLLKVGEIQIPSQKYTTSNYKRLIVQTANRISDYYSAMQDRYDDETKHGSDLEAQARWDDFLRSELNKYS